MIEAYCPRCDNVEMWDHVIKYNETIEIRKKFIKSLLIDLLKYREEVNINEIIAFCEDILRYLEGEENEDYKKNQHYVGMKELFRGYIIVDQIGSDLNCMKYRIVNKVIVRKCVEFYNQYWKYRNEVSHHEVKQKERLRKW